MRDFAENNQFRVNYTLFVVDFAVTHQSIDEIKRADINCKLIYTAEVHPGGWAPAKVVRNIGKREITKFLKRIGTFSAEYVSNKPIDL